MNKLITCVVPCYGRPERTIRALYSVVKQNIDDWEAIFIGDGCPFFQKNLEEGVFQKYKEEFGDKLTFLNLNKNYGGWGTMARKVGIELAVGKYICFLDNDDVILPHHFLNYASFMEENQDLDFAYFNAYTSSFKKERKSFLSQGSIGNCELIFKSNVLKKEYELDFEYEHDWRLVDKLKKKGYLWKKCHSPATYIIKSIPNDREKEYD